MFCFKFSVICLAVDVSLPFICRKYTIIFSLHLNILKQTVLALHCLFYLFSVCSVRMFSEKITPPPLYICLNLRSLTSKGKVKHSLLAVAGISVYHQRCITNLIHVFVCAIRGLKTNSLSPRYSLELSVSQRKNTPQVKPNTQISAKLKSFQGVITTKTPW